MVNYQDSKIYKLVCNVSGLQYIGSTTQPLHKRKYGHVASFNAWKNGKSQNYITCFQVIEAGEYDIVLLEKFVCTSKEELYARERFWIESSECVNRCIPSRTRAEYRKANAAKIAEYKKQYAVTNKQKIYEKKKKYREANAETIAAKKKIYQQQHRERLSLYLKEYHQTHRDYLREKVRCECGVSVSRENIRRHQKTERHKHNLLRVDTQ